MRNSEIVDEGKALIEKVECYYLLINQTYLQRLKKHIQNVADRIISPRGVHDPEYSLQGGRCQM